MHTSYLFSLILMVQSTGLIPTLTLLQGALRMLHSATERVILPRSEEGRGILDVKKLCNEQLANHYFHSRENLALYHVICQADKRLTSLNLSSKDSSNVV